METTHDDVGMDHLKKAKRTSLPFPSMLQVNLNVKLGEPLGKTRSPIGSQCFECSVSEGFDVLRHKVFVYSRKIADDYNKAGPKGNLVAQFDSDLKIYLKPSSSATQTDYVELNEENHLKEMHEAWRHAALRSSGQTSFKLELFVYGRKSRTIGSPREERKRPRKPMIDTETMEATDNLDQPSDTSDTAMERSHSDHSYRNVRVKLNGAIVELAINVDDLREALGMQK